MKGLETPFIENTHKLQTFVKLDVTTPTTSPNHHKPQDIKSFLHITPLSYESYTSEPANLVKQDHTKFLKDLLLLNQSTYSYKLEYAQDIYKLLMALPSPHYYLNCDNSVDISSPWLFNSLSNLKTCRPTSYFDQNDDSSDILNDYSNFYFEIRGRIPDDYFFKELALLDSEISSKVKSLDEKQLVDLNNNLITRQLLTLEYSATTKTLHDAVGGHILDPVLNLLQQTILPSVTGTENYSPRFRPSVLDELKTRHVTLRSDLVIFENQIQTCSNPPLLLVDVINELNCIEQDSSSTVSQTILNRLHAQCLMYGTDIIMAYDENNITFVQFLYDDHKETEIMKRKVSISDEEVDRITAGFRYRNIKRGERGLNMNWAIASLLYSKHLLLNNEFRRQELANKVNAHIDKLKRYLNRITIIKAPKELNNLRLITQSFGFKKFSPSKEGFTTVIRLRAIDYIELFKVDRFSISPDIEYVVMKVLDFSKIKKYYWSHESTISTCYADFRNWCIKCYYNELEAYRRINQYNSRILSSYGFTRKQLIHSPDFLGAGICSIMTPSLETKGYYLVLEYLEFINIKPNTRSRLEKVVPEIQKLNKLGIDHRDASPRNMCYNEDEGCVFVYDFNRVELTDSYVTETDNQTELFIEKSSSRYERDRSRSCSSTLV